MASNSLDGRSVVVTGGGTGIGAASAIRAAGDGATVTICGRTASKLDDVVARAADAGHELRAVVADITVEDDVARVMASAAEHGGGLHGVVANAGGGGGLAPYHLQTVEEFVRLLQLNVVGTMLCIKHAVPHLARAGGGSFVGMSSIAGHVTHPYFGAYPVAKAGIEEMIRNAADEYGEYRVRFNAVQPGFIATEVMQAVQPGSDIWHSYVDQTPLGDVGQPEDVANLIRFLLSDESRWITGQLVAIDGGHCLRRGPDFGPTVKLMYDAAALDPRGVPAP